MSLGSEPTPDTADRSLSIPRGLRVGLRTVTQCGRPSGDSPACPSGLGKEAGLQLSPAALQGRSAAAAPEPSWARRPSPVPREGGGEAALTAAEPRARHRRPPSVRPQDAAPRAARGFRLGKHRPGARSSHGVNTPAAAAEGKQ